MNKLTAEKQIAVINALVEGNSIRGTSRLTGVDKNTVMTLLARAGAACQAYQDKVLRNLPCQLIQCDEIWSYNFCRIHQTLRSTPAMRARLTNKVWGIADIVALLA